MLKLTVVSQEKQLLTQEVDSVTAMTSEGEITVLPGHVPLFSRLVLGPLTYRVHGVETHILITKGFLDVGVDGTITVISDSATHERDISIEKANAAVEDAKKTLQLSQNQEELLMAEASLKRALLEIRIAQRTKKSQA